MPQKPEAPSPANAVWSVPLFRDGPYSIGVTLTRDRRLEFAQRDGYTGEVFRVTLSFLEAAALRKLLNTMDLE